MGRETEVGWCDLSVLFYWCRLHRVELTLYVVTKMWRFGVTGGLDGFGVGVEDVPPASFSWAALLSLLWLVFFFFPFSPC